MGNKRSNSEIRMAVKEAMRRGADVDIVQQMVEDLLNSLRENSRYDGEIFGVRLINDSKHLTVVLDSNGEQIQLSSQLKRSDAQRFADDLKDFVAEMENSSHQQITCDEWEPTVFDTDLENDFETPDGRCEDVPLDWQVNIVEFLKCPKDSGEYLQILMDGYEHLKSKGRSNWLLDFIWFPINGAVYILMSWFWWRK